MDRAPIVATRAENGGGYTAATRGYWYVHDTGRLDVYRRKCYDVAHTQRPDVVRLTDPCNVGHAARVANVMNRLDHNDDAPHFDEQTGHATA